MAVLCYRAVTVSVSAVCGRVMVEAGIQWQSAAEARQSQPVFFPRLITPWTCPGPCVSTDLILIQFDPWPTQAGLWCAMPVKSRSMSPTLVVISSDCLYGAMNNPHHSSRRQRWDASCSRAPSWLRLASL